MTSQGNERMRKLSTTEEARIKKKKERKKKYKNAAWYGHSVLN